MLHMILILNKLYIISRGSLAIAKTQIFHSLHLHRSCPEDDVLVALCTAVIKILWTVIGLLSAAFWTVNRKTGLHFWVFHIGVALKLQTLVMCLVFFPIVLKLGWLVISWTFSITSRCITKADSAMYCSELSTAAFLSGYHELMFQRTKLCWIISSSN